MWKFFKVRNFFKVQTRWGGAPVRKWSQRKVTGSGSVSPYFGVLPCSDFEIFRDLEKKKFEKNFEIFFGCFRNQNRFGRSLYAWKVKKPKIFPKSRKISKSGTRETEQVRTITLRMKSEKKIPKSEKISKSRKFSKSKLISKSKLRWNGYPVVTPTAKTLFRFEISKLRLSRGKATLRGESENGSFQPVWGFLIVLFLRLI
jgi:hypothetical protein